jgi:hypothetical protein
MRRHGLIGDPASVAPSKGVMQEAGPRPGRRKRPRPPFFPALPSRAGALLSCRRRLLVQARTSVVNTGRVQAGVRDIAAGAVRRALRWGTLFVHGAPCLAMSAVRPDQGKLACPGECRVDQLDAIARRLDGRRAGRNEVQKRRPRIVQRREDTPPIANQPIHSTGEASRSNDQHLKTSARSFKFSVAGFV